jgi:hypothetical protein
LFVEHRFSGALKLLVLEEGELRFRVAFSELHERQQAHLLHD